MARRYRLNARARSQDQTRQRIVDAAVALHTSIGPARTTVSAIAERAGVQRHTFYRHFPDDRSLVAACSGQFNEAHPPPDPSTWQGIQAAEPRLRHGLDEVYRYYERNGAQLAPLVRDAQVHALTQEVMAQRMFPVFAQMRDTLAEAFHVKGPARRRLRGVLATMLDFTTWQGLREGVSSHAEAVEAATRAVLAQTHDAR